MSERLHVADRAQAFFRGAGSGHLFDRIANVGGQVDYILFVLMRYWVPTVLPPPGRERGTKNDPDYWLESEQILKTAAMRLRGHPGSRAAQDVFLARLYAPSVTHLELVRQMWPHVSALFTNIRELG